MSKLANLQSATCLREVAVVLGFKPKALSYILYIKNKADLYNQFLIPKKTGGTRTILSPCDELKAIQRKLSDYLQDCINEINSQRKITFSIAHAYKKKHSIATNARVHRGRRYVFNADLENFFDSINFGRVRGFFISNNNFKLHPDAATVLAQIACHNNSLPQGSPCSPVISNLIGHILDIRLARLASKEGCTYTRYADDLTFSTNKKIFPKSIAMLSDAEEHIWSTGKQLEKEIKKTGFAINNKKTRMQYKDSQQTVTGLVVNSKVNTRYSYRRTARAMADALFKTGKFTIKKPVQANGKSILLETPGTVEQLCGIFSYIHMIAEYNRSISMPNNKKLELSGIEKTYKELLFYRRFYANPRPLIIYEGKTDAVYLRCAIRSLIKLGEFPELGGINDKSEVEINADLFTYTKTASRILGLPGGAAPLKTLISEYLHNFSRYQAPGNTSPVIMLIDNDSGSKDIYSLIKQLRKEKNPIDGSEEHYYIAKNLFVVPTPKVLGKESKIEDFFTRNTLEMKIGTKSFDCSNDHDTETSYGKNAFAEQIVKANQNTIDFTGFRPILQRIVNVINYYRAI